MPAVAPAQQLEDDLGAERAADQVRVQQPFARQQLLDGVGQCVDRERPVQRLGGAEARQVERDDLTFGREHRDHQAPTVIGRPEPVHEHDRRPAAGAADLQRPRRDDGHRLNDRPRSLI